MDLEDRVAVVTGAASGIGRAAASAFAARGARVVLADLDEAGLSAAAAEIGPRARAVPTDVASDESVTALVELTLADFDRVDLMMNNAGVAIRGPVTEFTMDDWRWIVDINLLGVVRGTTAVLPHMLERGTGWIVNTASIAGLTGSPVGVPYATTKQAVVGFSESVALFSRPRGVGVTVLCPGGVATNIAAGMRKVGDDPRYWAGADQLATTAMPASDVAAVLLDGLDEGRFIVTTSQLSTPMSMRAEALERNAGARLDRAPTDLPTGTLRS